MPPSLTLPVPATVVPSPAMTGYKSGAPTRRAILLALLESEPRTVRGLADAVGLTEGAIRKHVRSMTEDGLLTVRRGIGRRGSAVRLTRAGREAARIL